MQMLQPKKRVREKERIGAKWKIWIRPISWISSALAHTAFISCSLWREQNVIILSFDAVRFDRRRHKRNLFVVLIIISIQREWSRYYCCCLLLPTRPISRRSLYANEWQTTPNDNTLRNENKKVTANTNVLQLFCGFSTIFHSITKSHQVARTGQRRILFLVSILVWVLFLWNTQTPHFINQNVHFSASNDALNHRQTSSSSNRSYVWRSVVGTLWWNECNATQPMIA